MTSEGWIRGTMGNVRVVVPELQLRERSREFHSEKGKKCEERLR
jgi:hypothetical protein